LKRIAFAWELGANLGHLERDLAVAQHLRHGRADVRFVVSNLQTAERILAPAGFPFLPCPTLRRPNSRPKTPINFSELLFDFGYDNGEALTGVVRAWMELWKLMAPDIIVTDYAPTALLSARIASIPTLPLGPGFCVPPNLNPMPAFQNEPRQSDAALRAADQRALLAVNQVIETFGGVPLEHFGALFETSAAQITSFPELDPFGPRADAQYVGPITAAGRFAPVRWPGIRSSRVFAYLHPSIVGLEAILAALRQPSIETICVIPGARDSLVSRYQSEALRIMTDPVDLDLLLPTSDAVVSYSSAGLVSTALLAGAPLLLFPTFLEHQLTAARAAQVGAAVIYHGRPTRENVMSALRALLSNPAHKQAARKFAAKYHNYRHEPAIEAVTEAILRLDRPPKDSGSFSQAHNYLS